jgi:dTDP-4-amino-4,6-dideoxygalactose transaminase
VHLAGQAADLEPLLAIAKANRLHVVEDAAQAHGTRYKGRVVGTFGVIGCFSFYPAKNLGALGDGGAVCTNEDGIAHRLRLLRNYGHEHVEKGLNARLDTLQAAFLQVKLAHLNEWNERRGEHARAYDKALAGVPEVRIPVRSSESTHVFHLYMIRTAKRAALRQYLAVRGVQTGIHYPQPIHLTPAYRNLGYSVGSFPNSERLSREVLSLPMYPELTDEQLDWVAQCVDQYFRGSNLQQRVASI